MRLAHQSLFVPVPKPIFDQTLSNMALTACLLCHKLGVLFYELILLDITVASSVDHWISE